MNIFASFSFTILLLSGAAVFAGFPPSHNVKGKIQSVIEDNDILFEGWYDPKNRRSRVDYFDSATKSYQLPHGDNITKFYKIVPAADGDRNGTGCYYKLFGKKIFQPTIPSKIDRRNRIKDEVNGIQCTLYTEVREYSYVVRVLRKYWVREDGSLEIPIRYEFKKYSNFHVLRHYFIDYYDYKERLIPPEVFKVDPELDNRCMVDHLTQFGLIIDPMYSYVDESNFRAEIIRRNLDFIDRINSAGLDYKLGINKFIDWTHEKYLALLSAKPLSSSIQYGSKPYPSENDKVPLQLPKELDLRKLGFVTPVKDQLETCKSSYAFSAAGALEGAYYKKYKTLITLSEQAIVDCAWTGGKKGNKGCRDGYPENVWRWTKKHGVPVYSDYNRRYSGIENYCVLSNQSFNIAAKDYRNVEPNSVDAIKQALVEYGPVAVSIYASAPSFPVYSSGVYTDPECLSGKGNYNALVVGYGVQYGTPYWLIKMSWGTTFGEDGYMKISQENNLCGVLDFPFFAIVN